MGLVKRDVVRENLCGNGGFTKANKREWDQKRQLEPRRGGQYARKQLVSVKKMGNINSGWKLKCTCLNETLR